MRFLLAGSLLLFNLVAFGSNDKDINKKLNNGFKYFLLLNPPLPVGLTKNQIIENLEYRKSYEFALRLAELVTGVSAENINSKIDQVPCNDNVACNDISVKYMIVLGSIISRATVAAITKDYMSDANFDYQLSFGRGRTNAIFAVVAAILGKKTTDIFQKLKSDRWLIEDWTPYEPEAVTFGTIMLMNIDPSKYQNVVEDQTGKHLTLIKQWLSNISILSGTPVKVLASKYQSSHHPWEFGLDRTQLIPVIKTAFGNLSGIKLYTAALTAVQRGQASDKRYSIGTSKVNIEVSEQSVRHPCQHADGTIYHYDNGEIYCGEVYFDIDGWPYDRPPRLYHTLVNRLRLKFRR